MTRLPLDIVEHWRGMDVLVVGDAMLDEWRFADAQRLSREAPAPVVTLRRQEDSAGGAGNTAANLAALGARPVLVALLGDDPEADRVRSCLRRAGVTDATVTVAGTTTAAKRRLVAGDQILSSEETPGSVSSVAADFLLASLRAAASDADRPPRALVICDYGRGALSGPVRRWLVAHRDSFPVVALDAHDLRRWDGLNPTLITPSYDEALPFLSHDADRPRPLTALEHGPDLLAATGADLAAVTLDAEGAVLVGADGATHRTWAEPAPPGHAVGAGDAYVAALTLALSVGAEPPAAAELAQLAAAATVAGTGTCVCRRDVLLAAVGDRGSRTSIVDRAALARLVRHYRDRDACIVFTNGCFDVLHRGHVEYLEQARRLGDVLIVAMNSDASVRRLKGPERPINEAADRAAVLAALSCVDHVVVFEEDSPTALIELVRPDIYVKGGDYRPDLMPEAPLVRRLGGEVRSLTYVPDRSTATVIERIRARAPIPDGREVPSAAR